MEFEKELIDILNAYTDGEWTDDPLDGDEVDRLVDHLKNRLNLLNGNITVNEYNIREENDNMEDYVVLKNYDDEVEKVLLFDRALTNGDIDRIIQAIAEVRDNNEEYDYDDILEAIVKVCPYVDCLDIDYGYHQIYT